MATTYTLSRESRKDGSEGDLRSISRPRRSGLIVSSAKVAPRGDGSFDVRLDALPPFRLPATPGRLFQLLSENNGHDIGDGLVGFKSNGNLLSKLNQFAGLVQNGTGPRTRRRSSRFDQAVSTLRKRLAQVVPDGDALVQTRRGLGFRVAVRKPARPSEDEGHR